MAADAGGAPRTRDVEVVESADELTRVACEHVLDLARRAIAQRGAFRIALSGGSTPRALYEALAGTAERTDFSAWHVCFGDERCVPPDDDASNYRMARRALLDHVAIPAAQVHRPPTEAGGAEEVARRYEETLRAAFTDPSTTQPDLDLVLLGLGTDGHTASLFPHADALAERRRWVAAARAGGHERVTLTPPAINAARSILFLVAGREKAPALARVLRASEPLAALPALGIRVAGTHWLVDRAAAGEPAA